MTERGDRRRLGLSGLAVLLVATALAAWADEESWQYLERRGYQAPRISAAEARKAVEASRPWHVGAVQSKREEEGVEVHVLINAAVGPIAKLAINPTTGEVLPQKVEVYADQLALSPEQIRQKVAALLPSLQVGSEAWLGGHGRYWRLPLFLRGLLVATVKVDARSGQLLPLRAKKAGER
ncbi:MAG: hypothetical protein KatS3mg131_3622 [Candidatus Tectimicrobiota bacterium]|nr:MAG: hypothetical protein KatS3mg131_3622 [Candidatus Tectomicrobia bacterium]